MSRKESWRMQARDAAYDYPRLHRELEAMHETNISPKLTGMPRGGGPSRSVEDAALRQLPPGDQTAHDAVEHAIRMMDVFRTGAKRKRLANLVYFRRTHTVYGAGVEIGISEETAKRWNQDFLLCIAGYLRAR